MTCRPIRQTRFRPLALSALGVTIAAGLYGMSPFLTLWTVAAALQHDDVVTVSSALDWRTVRAGLKADLGPGSQTMDGSVHLASARIAPVQDELPDFGDSFATTIVSHVIDDVVTPEHLVTMLTQTAPRRSSTPGGMGGALSMLGRIDHVEFIGPAHFEASMRMADDPAAAPVTVSMDVQKWHWKITRIHVPDQLLSQGAGNRT